MNASSREDSRAERESCDVEIGQVPVPLLGLTVLAGTGAVADEPARPIRALLVRAAAATTTRSRRGSSPGASPAGPTSSGRSPTTPTRPTRHKNPIYDNPDWSKDFDVVVHDECSSDVKDTDVIETILKPHKDGLPAVVLHCGMHSYRSEGWNKKSRPPGCSSPA